MRDCVSLRMNETDMVVVKKTNNDIISTPLLVTKKSAFVNDLVSFSNKDTALTQRERERDAPKKMTNQIINNLRRKLNCRQT